MKFLISKSGKNRQLRPKRRRLAAESLETRRVLAASVGWDGPGLGSAELTYTISGTPESLSPAEVEAAVETALDAWASVVDVSFTETNQTGLRDSLDLSFGNIDGSGGTLAQAYFPDDVNPDRLAGDIKFDSSEQWEVGNSQGSRAFDLAWVAAHEIGHALGLAHDSEVGSVLRAFTTPNQQFTGLDSSDVAAIRQLYAANTDATDLDPTTQPGPNTDSEIVPSDLGRPGQIAPDGQLEPETTPESGDDRSDPFAEIDRERRSFWNRFRFQFNHQFQRHWRFATEVFDTDNSENEAGGGDDVNRNSFRGISTNFPVRVDRFFFWLGR